MHTSESSFRSSCFNIRFRTYSPSHKRQRSSQRREKFQSCIEWQNGRTQTYVSRIPFVRTKTKANHEHIEIFTCDHEFSVVFLRLFDTRSSKVSATCNRRGLNAMPTREGDEKERNMMMTTTKIITHTNLFCTLQISDSCFHFDKDDHRLANRDRKDLLHFTYDALLLPSRRCGLFRGQSYRGIIATHSIKELRDEENKSERTDSRWPTEQQGNALFHIQGYFPLHRICAIHRPQQIICNRAIDRGKAISLSLSLSRFLSRRKDNSVEQQQDSTTRFRIRVNQSLPDLRSLSKTCECSR